MRFFGRNRQLPRSFSFSNTSHWNFWKNQNRCCSLTGWSVQLKLVSVNFTSDQFRMQSYKNQPWNIKLILHVLNKIQERTNQCNSMKRRKIRKLAMTTLIICWNYIILTRKSEWGRQHHIILEPCGVIFVFFKPIRWTK